MSGQCLLPPPAPRHLGEHRAAGSFPGTGSLTPTCLLSVVGLCVSAVTVVARFIREHFLDITRFIMYDERPAMDRVLHGHLPGPGSGGAGAAAAAAALRHTHLPTLLSSNQRPPRPCCQGSGRVGKQRPPPKALGHGDSPSAQPHGSTPRPACWPGPEPAAGPQLGP